jgi:hypothetical protein
MKGEDSQRKHTRDMLGAETRVYGEESPVAATARRRAIGLVPRAFEASETLGETRESVPEPSPLA